MNRVNHCHHSIFHTLVLELVLYYKVLYTFMLKNLIDDNIKTNKNVKNHLIFPQYHSSVEMFLLPTDQCA